MSVTYCICVEQDTGERVEFLQCPLPEGRCYWQQMGSKLCCHTGEDLTPEEFAERSGRPLASEKEIAVFTDKLRVQMRD